MKKYFYLFVAIGITFLSACGDSKENTGEENQQTTGDTLSATEEVVNQIDSIKGIAISYWGLLNQADSTKFANINRLFDEISYNPNHDAARLEELKAKLPEIQALSYNYDEIPNEDSIGIIDTLVGNYISAVNTFKTETSGMEGYPLAKELSDTIKFLNEPLLTSLSASYAQHAKIYNAYISVYKKSLNELNKSYEPLKLFFDQGENEPEYTKEELDALLEDLRLGSEEIQNSQNTNGEPLS